MRLLLDEMWAPAIAQQLRRRGYDAIAVAERPELRGQADAVIFAFAQEQGRAIVTENVSDYRQLALDTLREGHSHTGVIFTHARAFPRGNTRTAGRLVRALAALMADYRSLDSSEWWLGG